MDAQPLDKPLLILLAVVDQAAQAVESTLRQTVMHDVEGGAFGTDEEHSLATCDVVGDEVGDGLRFSRPRWSLNDVARSAARSSDRRILGRIADHDWPQLGRIRRWRHRVNGSCGIRKDRIECGVAGVPFKQGAVIPYQGHLPVVEIPQGQAAQVDLPRIGIRLAVFAHLKGLAGADPVLGCGRGNHPGRAVAR